MSDTPLATFAHLSDLHWGGPSAGPFALADERVACALADIRRDRPDWVVVSGDLSSDGAVHPQALREVRRRLGALGVPWDTVPGNHDLSPSPEQAAGSNGLERYEPGALEHTTYGRAFGVHGLRWERTLAGVAFLGVTLRAGDPDGELPRLGERLRQAGAARARIVVGHYPVAPVRGGGTLATWGPHQLGPTAADLERVLVGGGVTAYLFGHVHVLCAGRREGVWHLTPGAVGAGCPGYRRCAIFADRVEMRFTPLSRRDLAECGFWSPGRPERCVDTAHPDHYTYHAGTREERDVVVGLGTPDGGAAAPRP